LAAIECILKRHSIRRYKPEPLAESDLEPIIRPAAPVRLTAAKLLDHRN